MFQPAGKKQNTIAAKQRKVGLSPTQKVAKGKVLTPKMSKKKTSSKSKKSPA